MHIWKADFRLGSLIVRAIRLFSGKLSGIRIPFQPRPALTGNLIANSSDLPAKSGIIVTVCIMIGNCASIYRFPNLKCLKFWLRETFVKLTIIHHDQANSQTKLELTTKNSWAKFWPRCKILSTSKLDDANEPWLWPDWIEIPSLPNKLALCVFFDLLWWTSKLPFWCLE